MKSTIMAAQIRSTKRPERRDFGKIREHIAERANIYLGFRGNLKNLASKFWTSNQSCVLLVFTIHNNLLKLSVWSNRSENYPRFLLGLFGILNSDHHNIHSFRILKSRKKMIPELKIEYSKENFANHGRSKIRGQHFPHSSLIFFL